MTSWRWNGGTADWYTGNDWVPLSTNAATFPQSGDTAAITAGTATISAADVQTHGTINGVTLYLDAGLSATNESFGAKSVIFGDVARASSTLTLTGTSTFAGTIDAIGAADSFRINAGVLINTGTIAASALGGLFVINASTLINSGRLGAVSADSLSIAAGATVINDSLLVADDGALTIAGSLQGGGFTFISQNGVASLAAVSAEQNIVFSDATGTLVVPASGFNGVIEDYQPGDIIDVLGLTATSVAFDGNDGVLSLFNGTSLVDTLEIAGGVSLTIGPDVVLPSNFRLTSDGHGGVLINGPEERVWADGNGQWYNSGSWVTNAPTAGFPVAGDTVIIPTGTASISAADVAAHGSLDHEVIYLGQALSPAAVLNAAGESFGAGVTLVGLANAALNLIGASSFAGYLGADGVSSQLVVLDSSTLTNSGIMFAGDNSTLTLSAPDLVNNGRLYAGQGVLALTQGVVLGTGRIELGDSPMPNNSLGDGVLEIGAGVKVAASQTIDFLNGSSNALLLSLTHPNDFAARINGFVRGDQIALQGLVAASDTYDATAGTLALFAASGASPVAVLDFGPGYVASDFTLTPTIDLLGNETLLTTARATSDGADEALHGNQARSLYNVTGAGITIGVISSSFNDTGNLAADVASGDLPANVDIVQDGTHQDDEGRAMAELIHRIAPGASFDFYTSGTSAADLATAITMLGSLKPQIIVDDIVGFDEPFFETGGPVFSAIANLPANVNYFTSIGNYGTLYYQGSYHELDSVLPHLSGTVKATDFGGGNPLQALQIDAGAAIDLVLQWDQPFAGVGNATGSANSLSMYLYDAAGDIVASGTTSALGKDPIQELSWTNTISAGVYRLAIVWDQGTVAPGTFKYIDTKKSGLVIDDPNAEQGSGTAIGHQEAPGVNVVGAVDYAQTPAYYDTPPTIESFSDTGPGLTLFNANGQSLATPLTPGVPDFVSADGPSTSSLDPFFGTSAAAPDAAAVAALMLQANPGLSPAKVTSLLEQSAVSLGLPTADQGAGLIQADQAVALAEAACFLAGTNIATGHGEIAVERLRPGALVRTLEGALRPVRWVGWRRVHCASHPHPMRVWPVRVQASAFAQGVPARDLYLSPDHAVFSDGVLIPIRQLINGHTVAQIEVAAAEYWHLELDRHDVLLAEGLAAESYLDTGNRFQFSHCDGPVSLHPEFAPSSWDDACAPLHLDGPIVSRLRGRLLARAPMLGWTTVDNHLRLAVGGRVGKACSVRGNLHSFLVPPGTRELRLLSGSIVPGGADLRRVGARLGGLVLDNRLLALDNVALRDGFHATECRSGRRWRWTDGSALIRLASPTQGPSVLEAQILDLPPVWKRHEGAVPALGDQPLGGNAAPSMPSLRGPLGPRPSRGERSEPIAPRLLQSSGLAATGLATIAGAKGF